jgi:hypothetical protein
MLNVSKAFFFLALMANSIKPSDGPGAELVRIML